MPLFAGSSVPRTSSKPGLPGDHSNTAPVGFSATIASANVVPGMNSTVATIEPSANDATLLAASPSGMGTQPRQVKVGRAPVASTSKISIASRAPCPTT